MFSFHPFSKIWSQRAGSHSTIHTIAKATVQRTESDESDTECLLPSPSGEIAHSRIHGVVQTFVQEDADADEEEEEYDDDEEEEEEEEIEEWISVSQTKVNEPDNNDVEDESTSQNTHLPIIPTTPQPLSPTSSSPSLPSINTPSPPSTPTTSSSHPSTITHIGTDTTIITHMTTMLSRLEKSQETDFLHPRQEAEFMYSDPWIMLERAEAELRDRVVFLLRGVLYGSVVDDGFD
ncbi:MAG: hypothetical protein LQ349_009798 [Xanthoria aureola]|nr:MAG: hypothetical protein LQ349_009798 [Xanthoria aureola]